MTFEHFWMNNWNSFTDWLRKQYPHLTDEDLQYTTGEEQKVIDRLKDKLGLRSHEIEELMMQNARPADTYDVTENAFRGMTGNDPDQEGFTGTYKDDDGERKRMPPTYAPGEGPNRDDPDRSQQSDTDPRR